jgi:hypothetical protein
MKNNKWTLEYVIEKLKKGEKIMTNLGAKWDTDKIYNDSNMSSLFHRNKDNISNPSMGQVEPFKVSKSTNLLLESERHFRYNAKLRNSL